MDDPTAHAFEAASRYLVDLVAAVPADGWEAPGLGRWTVRELVAHANRAHTTVVDYVERPQAPVSPGSDYFSETSIEARAREAVAALGTDPAAAVAEASQAAIDLVRRRPPETPVGSPAGRLTLAGYLSSRVAELTVHGLDLARAIASDVAVGGDDAVATADAAPPLPAEALEEALVFVARRAGRAGGRRGVEALLALTGRAALPAGFTVY